MATPQRSENNFTAPALAASVAAEPALHFADAGNVPSLRRNFSWTFAGNVFYAGCQWGMLAVMAKLSTPATVGEYALGLAITAPVFMLTNLQLRGIQATDARSEFAFADYFGLRCLTTTLALGLVSGIVLLSQTNRTVAWVTIALALAKAVESLSDAVAGRLQKVEHMDRVATALALRGTASLLAFAAVFTVYRSLLAAALSAAVCSFAIFITYDLVQARRTLATGEKFCCARSRVLQSLVVLALPLGVVTAMNSLVANFPRYVLEARCGSAQLGIFASLAYLITAVTFVVNALGQSATARLSRLFAAGDLESFAGLISRFVALGATMGAVGSAGALALGRLVLSFLYQPQYGNYPGLLAMLLATAGVSAIGSFLGYGMTAARCFRAQVPIVAVSAGIAVGGSLILVPAYGMYGAAAAWFAAAVAHAAMSAAVLRSRVRRQGH